MPGLIAAATATGLIAGMLGDGAWDAIAALALAVPIAAMTVGLLRSRRVDGR